MKGGEAGVSNVLGAVLMFGLLVLTLSVVQVRFVPVWEEDREARGMQRAADDLRQLQSDLARQAGNDTASSLTQSLALTQAGGFRFFQSPADATATLSFVPAPIGTGIQALSTDPVRILRRNGQNLFGAGNTWDPLLDGNTVVHNVQSIEHLRVRVDLYDEGTSDSYIGGPNTNDYDASDTITLAIYAANDNANPAARFVTRVTVNSGEFTFSTTLFNGAGDAVSAEFESLFQQVTQPYLYIDLLSDAFFLKPLLASAQAPFRMELNEAGLFGDYQVAYAEATAGGIAGSAGIPSPTGFTTTRPSGRLAVQANNQHYVDQTYILEHSAVLLEQDNRAVVVSPPNLSAAIGPGQATVSWTIPGLGGDSITRSASRAGVLATPTGSIEDLWVLAPSLSLVIPTDHADAWAAYLEGLLVANGWTGGQYAITASSVNVRLDLQGPVLGDPTSPDISFRFRHSAIDLDLTNAG